MHPTGTCRNLFSPPPPGGAHVQSTDGSRLVGAEAGGHGLVVPGLEQSCWLAKAVRGPRSFLIARGRRRCPDRTWLGFHARRRVVIGQMGSV